jgi:hypothetical protein
MKYICPLCLIDPLSHSLTKLSEKDNVVYYYTCPSKAKLYYDVNSIIDHYEGVLNEIPENKQWVWILDGNGYNLIHLMQCEVAIELIKLISSKFSKNLKKIIIINSTFYLSFIYHVINPFLLEEIKSIIEMNYVIKNAIDII